ncbi:MAG: hypothetical protein ACTSV3_08155 [Candidatus Thorarchaeota archaeon]|nr:MAG: hypothetical protein DRO87_10740 [Candidatus Thorarchaeota archaeon]RLI56335.1 MAG: hypothetical protein DRP09_06895 [Candidatus Thorarchaeota archaeon]
MDINNLYIIKRETGVCIYSKDFSDSAFDPQLLSSFIVAMTSFFDEATRSLTSQARAFAGSDYTIIVEFGEWTLGAVSTKSDTADMRAKLRRVIDRFEEQFNLLRWVDMDLAIQTRFEQSVIDIFVRDGISEDSYITVKPGWEHYTSRPDVISFLRLIPAICTVKEAADFLEVPVEIAMNLTAEAVWENAATISNPVKPDDIYQATSLIESHEPDKEISPRAAKALLELDGETPLSIAAERLKTADLKQFLEEIAWLEKRRMVELVAPSQAVVVRNSTAIQNLLTKYANIVGCDTMRHIFFESRERLIGNYPWLAYVTLEEGVDFEMRSSLTSSTTRGSIEPDVLADGFKALMQFMTRRVSAYIGPRVSNRVLKIAQRELEQQFPSTVYQIEWEALVTKRRRG